MKTKTTLPVAVQPRLRVWVGDEVALGPGKAELLRLVRLTGSISAAAKRMGMSYMRAWTLIQTMNRCFKQPLLVPMRGGEKHGGTELTPTGIKALECYEQMERVGLKAMAGQWRRLRRMVRD